MTSRKFDLGIAIALVPILGTGLVLMNQLGRFMFYEIPFEFIEIDAYKILVSSLSMIFLGSAALYAGSVYYDATNDSGSWARLVYHLGFATTLTLPFWSTNLRLGASISWATIGFIVFTAGVLFGIERWVRRQAVLPTQEKLSGWALVAFFASALVLAATLAHGYLAERDRTTYVFITGTQDAVVARMGNVLILKTYNPSAHTFINRITRFQEVGINALETRTLPR